MNKFEEQASFKSNHTEAMLRASPPVSTDGLEAGEVSRIDSFQGEHRWLSNFWPVVVQLDGETYPSVEHAYQAAKSLDPLYRETIRHTREPGAAKRLGRGAILRRGWISLKDHIMEDLVRQKFQDPELRAKLSMTGDAELVEGNTWGDTYWGVCRGRGQNLLGKLLMKVRSEIHQNMTVPCNSTQS